MPNFKTNIDSDQTDQMDQVDIKIILFHLKYTSLTSKFKTYMLKKSSKNLSPKSLLVR